MGTTATTITGAIKELRQRLDALPDFSSYQTATTTWTKPDVSIIVNNQNTTTCTIVSGGYFREGKHVYVQMRINSTFSISADTAYWLTGDMPHSAPNYGVFSAIFSNNGGGSAYVTTSGELYIKTPPDVSVSTSTNIYITGHYVTA